MIGIDEAGRGALAGPLVVASVYIEDPVVAAQDFALLPVRDSKTLSERQRETVYESVCRHSIQFEIVCIPVVDINRKGIGWANTNGIKKLIKVGNAPSCIVDGYFPKKKIAVKGVDVRCQVDADATVFQVILAGIVAKVTRDRMMKKLHSEFREYGWERNKGYGTREHIEAIRNHGACKYHRDLFVNTALQKK